MTKYIEEMYREEAPRKSTKQKNTKNSKAPAPKKFRQENSGKNIQTNNQTLKPELHARL
ncbi:hypothetical protein [Kerstersia sp.]|uniref:hypothetical protein n=1 Tax=Kerstersia sp. TaxID=1930783 RepID=UPI003F8EAFD5